MREAEEHYERTNQQPSTFIKKARTEDQADGRLQDPFHGEDKHLDKNPAIIQVHRESKSRGLPEGANF